MVGRVTTVSLLVLTSVLALFLSNALQAFNILLQIGAGTGLIFILRWFWWRINAYSELAAMVISFLVAIYFEIIHGALGFASIAEGVRLLLGVGITTLGWVLVTLMTPPEKSEVLEGFYRLTRPGGPGWKKVVEEMKEEAPAKAQGWDVPQGILAMLVGCLAVYSTLFATGYWIYGRTLQALLLTGVAVLSVVVLFRLWKLIHRPAS
jgi:hypothetical protein